MTTAVLREWPVPAAVGRGPRDRVALGTAALPPLSGPARKSMKNPRFFVAPRPLSMGSAEPGLTQFFGLAGCSTAGGPEPSNGADFELSKLSMAARGSTASMYS